MVVGAFHVAEQSGCSPVQDSGVVGAFWPESPYRSHNFKGFQFKLTIIKIVTTNARIAIDMNYKYLLSTPLVPVPIEDELLPTPKY